MMNSNVSSFWNGAMQLTLVFQTVALSPPAEHDQVGSGGVQAKISHGGYGPDWIGVRWTEQTGVCDRLTTANFTSTRGGLKLSVSQSFWMICGPWAAAVVAVKAPTTTNRATRRVAFIPFICDLRAAVARRGSTVGESMGFPECGDAKPLQSRYARQL